MHSKKTVSPTEPWYVEERLRALTILQLTRRDDLSWASAPSEMGLDYIVEIQRKGKPSGRRFGLQLMPTQGGKSIRELPVVDCVPFPVCIFKLDIADETALYAWAREQIIQEGEAKLKEHALQGDEELDQKGLNGIVNQVSRWYDALLKNLTA